MVTVYQSPTSGIGLLSFGLPVIANGTGAAPMFPKHQVFHPARPISSVRPATGRPENIIPASRTGDFQTANLSPVHGNAIFNTASLQPVRGNAIFGHANKSPAGGTGIFDPENSYPADGMEPFGLTNIILVAENQLFIGNESLLVSQSNKPKQTNNKS